MTTGPRTPIAMPARETMVRGGIPPEVTAHYVERAHKLRAEAFAGAWRSAGRALARLWAARRLIRRLAPLAPPAAGPSYR